MQEKASHRAAHTFHQLEETVFFDGHVRTPLRWKAPIRCRRSHWTGFYSSCACPFPGVNKNICHDILDRHYGREASSVISVIDWPQIWRCAAWCATVSRALSLQEYW